MWRPAEASEFFLKKGRIFFKKGVDKRGAAWYSNKALGKTGRKKPEKPAQKALCKLNNTMKIGTLKFI